MWKHKIAFSGNERNVTSFVKALMGLGYKPSGAYSHTTGKPYCPTQVNVTNGVYDDFDIATVNNISYYKHRQIEYSFNIDNKWEYEAALAICSMRNDNDVCHEGEWIYFLQTYDRAPSGHIAQITNIYKESYESKGWISYTPKVGNGGGFRWAISPEKSGYSIGIHFRKATAEEIINYFKNKYSMSTKQIGWIVPENLFGGLVRKGTIYPLVAKGFNGAKPSDESSDTLWLPREIIEKWEPSYEKQEKSVIIGSRNVKVFVEGERVYTKDERIDTTIEELEELLDSLDEMELEISGFNVSIKADERCIRIGCVEENNLFSLNELNSVWELHK